MRPPSGYWPVLSDVFCFLGPTIADLRVTSIKQTEVTFTWRVIGSYDKQVSTFKAVGEDAQHKNLPNNGESTFTETIRGLKPCKRYEITVTVFRGGLEFKKSFNVTTSPIGNTSNHTRCKILA